MGSTETIKVDVRLIAATNQDLAELVEAGRFRKDLYYRLNVVNIEIPPLRERPEDILPLAEFFIRKYSEKMNKRIVGLTEKAQKLNMESPASRPEKSPIAFFHAGSPAFNCWYMPPSSFPRCLRILGAIKILPIGGVKECLAPNFSVGDHHWRLERPQFRRI